MAFEVRRDGYVITDDAARFDLARAHRWIATESYWAEGIPLTTFEKAIRHSLTFAAYARDGEMAAFGRVVTDRATFGWLCDVFVDERDARHGRTPGKHRDPHRAAPATLRTSAFADLHPPGHVPTSAMAASARPRTAGRHRALR